MKGTKRLSIIAVTYFSEKEIPECLAALDGFDKDSVEIIIYDNGSKDGTVDFLKKNYGNNPQYNLIFSPKNLGCSVAINECVRVAKSDIFVSINPDTTVTVPAIMEMLEYLENHPEIGIIGPKINDEHGVAQETYGDGLTPWNELLGKTMESKYLEIFPWVKKRKQERLNVKHPIDVGWIGGACLMARSGPFMEVGGIDKHYFMSYADMIDLAKKMKNIGLKSVLYAPALVIHSGGKSSVRDRDTVLRQSYSGTLHYFKEHYGWPTLLLANVIYVTTSGVKALIAGIISLFKRNPYRDIAKAHAKNVVRIFTGTIHHPHEYQ